jgi:transcriptional regulator with XRE-family HTH domain
MNSPMAGREDDPLVLLRVRPNTFAGFLRKERLGRHMPRARLANLTGLSEKALAGFESNMAVPSSAEMRKLAAALGLTEHEILVRARCINPEHRAEEMP